MAEVGDDVYVLATGADEMQKMAGFSLGVGHMGERMLLHRMKFAQQGNQGIMMSYGFLRGYDPGVGRDPMLALRIDRLRAYANVIPKIQEGSLAIPLTGYTTRVEADETFRRFVQLPPEFCGAALYRADLGTVHLFDVDRALLHFFGITDIRARGHVFHLPAPPQGWDMPPAARGLIEHVTVKGPREILVERLKEETLKLMERLMGGPGVPTYPASLHNIPEMWPLTTAEAEAILASLKGFHIRALDERRNVLDDVRPLFDFGLEIFMAAA